MTLRERIIADMNLSEKRRTHTFGVEKAVLMLAKRHFPFFDGEEASACALLHDFTKEKTKEEQFSLCEKYGIILTDEEKSSVPILHGYTAAAIAKEEYGLSDEACSAIKYHSTLRKNCTEREEILFLADYIEENRIYRPCVLCREYYEGLYNSGDENALEKAILFAADNVIKENISKGNVIVSDTLQARNFLIMKLKAKGAVK